MELFSEIVHKNDSDNALPELVNFEYSALNYDWNKAADYILKYQKKGKIDFYRNTGLALRYNFWTKYGTLNENSFSMVQNINFEPFLINRIVRQTSLLWTFEALRLKERRFTSSELYYVPLSMQYFIKLKMTPLDSKFLSRVLDTQENFIRCTDYTGLIEMKTSKAILQENIGNQKLYNTERIKIFAAPLIKITNSPDLIRNDKHIWEAYATQDELKIIKILEERGLIPESSRLDYLKICKESDESRKLEIEFWEQ